MGGRLKSQGSKKRAIPAEGKKKGGGVGPGGGGEYVT